jgi:RecJ-like exonuclease
MNTIKCTNCDGRGSAYEDHDPRTNRLFRDVRTGGPEFYRVDCPVCDGKGYIVSRLEHMRSLILAGLNMMDVTPSVSAVYRGVVADENGHIAIDGAVRIYQIFREIPTIDGPEKVPFWCIEKAVAEDEYELVAETPDNVMAATEIIIAWVRHQLHDLPLEPIA